MFKSKKKKSKKKKEGWNTTKPTTLHTMFVLDITVTESEGLRRCVQKKTQKKKKKRKKKVFFFSPTHHQPHHHQPLTIPMVTSGPSPPAAAPFISFKLPSALTHRSQAHLVNSKTSSSPKSSLTWSSNVTTNEESDIDALLDVEEETVAVDDDDDDEVCDEARLGVSCQICGAGRCTTWGWRSTCCA